MRISEHTIRSAENLLKDHAIDKSQQLVVVPNMIARILDVLTCVL